jgi:anti-sigma factor RsiW
MDCIELVELVTLYIEGELPKNERRRFDAHLRGCPHCVVYLQQMRATLVAVGSIPVESIGPVARRRLLQAFHDWKSG